MNIKAQLANPYPTPAIYDILNSPGTRQELDSLLRIAHRHTPAATTTGKQFFEPACGTGRYLKLAAKRGFRVAGFDHDVDMLSYAGSRRGMERAILFKGQMGDFLTSGRDVGLTNHSVDMAFNLVNTIRHLESDAELVNHLDQIGEVLKPGCLYIVGISLVDYHWLEPEEDLWEGRRGRCQVSQLVNYLPPEPGTPRARIETVISHLTITTPSGATHLDHNYQLRTYDETQWVTALTDSHLTRVASYDGLGHPLDNRKLPYQLEVLVTR